jgi:hypothetical protein
LGQRDTDKFGLAYECIWMSVIPQVEEIAGTEPARENDEIN